MFFNIRFFVAGYLINSAVSYTLVGKVGQPLVEMTELKGHTNQRKNEEKQDKIEIWKSSFWKDLYVTNPYLQRFEPVSF